MRTLQPRTDDAADEALIDLESLVGFELRRAYNASARKFVEILADVSLKPGQYGLLLAIERKPDQTQSAIAKMLSIDRSTIVPLLDQLERKGYVTRIPNPNDRRAHSLRLTAVGAWVLKQSRSLVAAHETLLTEGFSASEKRTILAFLRQLRLNCE